MVAQGQLPPAVAGGRADGLNALDIFPGRARPGGSYEPGVNLNLLAAPLVQPLLYPQPLGRTPAEQRGFGGFRV